MSPHKHVSNLDNKALVVGKNDPKNNGPRAYESIEAKGILNHDRS